MDDINDLALSAFELIEKAKAKIKGELGEGDQAAFDDMIELLTAAMQVSYGERITTAFFNIRIERLSAFLKEGEKRSK